MTTMIGHVVRMAGGNAHPATWVVARCAGYGGKPHPALGQLTQRAWPNNGMHPTPRHEASHQP